MKPVLVILFCILAQLVRAEDAKVLKPEEVKNHIGERVTVRGKVVQVVAAKRNCWLLNLGGKYPDQACSIFIEPPVSFVTNWYGWRGQEIQMSGKAQLYKGAVQIKGEGIEQQP